MSSSSAKIDDEALVRACVEGDDAAWGLLLQRYRRLIFSIPLTYRMSVDEAEEVLQVVALKLFRHIGSLRSAGSLGAWIAVTTRNTCQTALRTGKRWRSLDDEVTEEPGEAPPDLAADLHEVACEHTLSLAFEQMDPTCQTLLGALYLDDPPKTYETISQIMDRPIGSLGPTRARCLDKLRRIYDDLGGEEP
ncbi:MAG: sigma-70 family RNA polymerase sigma factor [Acidobacteriota bacterium]|nr:sigma-70 family RNA polymerase sigma factor [Acidobacteriota bacterium]MDH3785328.1 sigma-70 family RNA polymerase sigma factor [Acidobacteriota bacterium]